MYDYEREGDTPISTRDKIFLIFTWIRFLLTESWDDDELLVQDSVSEVSKKLVVSFSGYQVFQQL